jgi:hypothetical protein
LSRTKAKEKNNQKADYQEKNFRETDAHLDVPAFRR